MSDARALLVIDLVDSTSVAARVGDDAMSAFWRVHDRVARDLLKTWRGREIDRSDGFFLLFDAADDALGYALAYHLQLRALRAGAEPLCARAGIHVGPLTLRANPPEDVARGAKPLEADGLAKAIAARVMSVARGGQTLLSGAAHAAIARSGARTRSHGHWRLKGLTEPVELFEAGDADAVFVPPADGEKVHRVVRREGHWLPAREVAHSLPPEPDPFIGRNDALRELSRRIDDGARLICVHGMGGSGKTRLALHYGWRWLGDFASGVWFCDLSTARDLDGVVRAVARGLELPLGRGDPIAQLGKAIAGRGACLVIVDNFEQVITLAGSTLGAWLAAAPQARFVVTSREVLRLPGEQVLALSPMSRAEGVELYERRAAAAGAPATANASAAADVERLVDLLDGLPLAIELAAGRAALLTPGELLQRMGQRFKLLAGARGRPDRQATLRATLDWSWELLNVAERDALAQLSVFEGGATLAAIEATVERGSGDDSPAIVDMLQSLIEKSFVRRAGKRIDLLATVRDYAAKCLATPGRFPGSGEQALSHARARHWRWFAAQPSEDATRDGCADLGNWIAATRHATVAGDAAAACALLEGAWAALRLRGPFSLAVELASQVARLPALDARQRSRVDRIAGWALRASGRVAEARQRLDAALAAARSAGDAQQEAHVRALLGDLHLNEGRTDDGRCELQQALDIARRTGERLLECQVLSSLGNVDVYQGNLEAAAERYEQVLALARACAHRRWEGGALGNLGTVRDQQGRADEARRLYESAIDVARELGDRQWEGNNLCNLGLLLHLHGEPEPAQQALRAALDTARQLGHARLECIASMNAALVAVALGQTEAAETLFATALRLAVELNDRRSEGQVRGNLGALYARLGRWQAARESLETADALLAPLGDKLSEALLLCDRAEYELLAGHGTAARDCAEQARALAAGIAAGPASELGRRLAAIDRLLAAAHGPPAVA